MMNDKLGIMRFRKTFFFIVVMLSMSKLDCIAQAYKSNIKDTTVNAKILSLNFSYHAPLFDMNHRFGFSELAGGSFQFKFGKNIVAGIDGGYLFGNRVKEDSILKFIRDTAKQVIGNTGNFTQLLLYESGYQFSVKAGKIFPGIKKWNPNSGVFVQFGAGFIQHKIIIRDPENVVPQVHDDYAKGYDRLTNGVMLSQFVGVIHLDTRKIKNFYFGAEFMEGFTKVRRDYDFVSMAPLIKNRFDMLAGIRVGWMLPFYGKNEQRFYSY